MLSQMPFNCITVLEQETELNLNSISSEAILRTPKANIWFYSIFNQKAKMSDRRNTRLLLLTLFLHTVLVYQTFFYLSLSHIIDSQTHNQIIHIVVLVHINLIMNTFYHSQIHTFQRTRSFHHHCHCPLEAILDPPPEKALYLLNSLIIQLMNQNYSCPILQVPIVSECHIWCSIAKQAQRWMWWSRHWELEKISG